MVFLISGSTYAQRGDLILSFSGKNIETNTAVPLESVFINNITKGCDTTLYGETPFLYLLWPSGINDNIIGNNVSFTLQPNYPNPFSGTTNLKIELLEKENLRLLLSDINGASIYEFEIELYRGLHTFEVEIGKNSICFLSVSNGEISKSIKLISNVTSSSSNQIIKYIGGEVNSAYKSGEEIESFEFSPGDQLLLKASASGYYDNTLYDNPNENTNYVFELQNEVIITLPLVTTSSLTDITQNSATSGGNVTDDGGANVASRGVCWSTSQNPTISNNHTVDGSGMGTFTSYLTGLSENTTYYVRAYATNSVGTSYGNQISFTTGQSTTSPSVTTSPVTDITQNSATSGGNVTDDGGANVISRGACWSTSQNPTINDNHTTDGSGMGTFTSYLTGLSENTAYYVRAYATNSVGTAYGNQHSLTTGQTITTPIVNTSPVTGITQNSATSGGDVTDDGGANLTSRGVCWSTSQNPTISNNHTVDGSGMGTFTSYLTGLSENTTYYVKAYATNSIGTAYGDEINFTTLSNEDCPPIISDIDGNFYKTIEIGNQCWMSENLRTTTYQNGILIPNVTNENEWSNLTSGAFVFYDNDTTWKNLYGALYNWHAGVNPNGLCPSGWHVPTDVEWTLLNDFIGGTGSPNGNRLRSCRQINSPLGDTCNTIDHPRWNSDNDNWGTDDYGFSGLPGSTAFDNQFPPGFMGFWWSSIEDGYDLCWRQTLIWNNGSTGLSKAGKQNGLSIRCLRNDQSTNIPEVETANVINLTQNSATSGGNVTDDGGATVTSRGICWSTNPNPTITDYFTINDYGLGSFISYLTNLTENTTYYVRAYATNSVGIAYGEEISFATLNSSGNGEPCPGSETVTYGGQVYNTALIGGQCWFRENLNIGEMILGDDEMEDNSSIEKYCFNDDPLNCEEFGGLYQWEEVMQYTGVSGTQGICPTGWHVPTDDEWKILEGYVDSQYPVFDPEWDNDEWRGFDVGKNIKSNTEWNGLDLYNFNALPSGSRGYNGNFNQLNQVSYLWSSDEWSSGTSWSRYLDTSSDQSYRLAAFKVYGFSLRCIRDY